MIVVKSFEFDAAHRLYPYEGKCSNIHGHRYKVEVGVSSPHGLDGHGMVVDFGSLKRVVGAFIDSNLDHQLILSQYDPQLATLSEMNAVQVMRNSPTAEILVEWLRGSLAEVVHSYISHSIQLEYVRLYETPTSYAEWKRS